MDSAPCQTRRVVAIIAALGLVAQLVEQRIENPCVGGSIPPRATKNKKLETPTLAGRRFRFLPTEIIAPDAFPVLRDSAPPLSLDGCAHSLPL